MTIGPALLTGVAFEDHVSTKVRRAAIVARARVFSIDAIQLVVHEARLADCGRYGRRGRSPDGPLPASMAEKLGVLLPGVRSETVVGQHGPASVARRR